MSVFRADLLKTRTIVRRVICLIILSGVALTVAPVYGQGLRAMFEAYKEEQKLNEINGGPQKSRSNASSDYVIIAPTVGNRQADHNTVQVFPNQQANQTQPPVANPVPVQIASTQRREFEPQRVSQPTDWSDVTLRAAQQSPQAAAMADEATVRRALLGERQNDARLNDVCFATPLIGWAVGDCGVIWHTQNGGQNWQMQESGTDAPLFAVDFIDPLNGFAVGGTTEPYSHRGRGVVLRTSNGGQSWERLATFAFPILYCVRIDAPGNLWVAGSASEQCPTGILRTADNGQTWQVLPGAKNEGWASLGFIKPDLGAGIGLDGAIQVVRDKPALSRTPPLGSRRANAVDVFNPPSISAQHAGAGQQAHAGQRVSPYSGWLAGDGGVIMCSRNTGMTWEVPQGFLPVNRPDLFDFQTVFARETNVWVAGNPGTLIFHSNDCGATWQATPTGIATPIRKIRFITPERGFAVGDLGAILATHDGGRSWHVQRAGGARLAVLGIFGRVQDVPYEAMSQLCLEEGYLGGVGIVFRQDSMRNTGGEIPAMKRLHEALVNCGGTSSTQPWAFSIDHDELAGNIERIVERLEFENDGHGLARLRENLVATIRTWRPNVILASGNVPQNDDSQNGNDMLRDPVRDLLQREILWAVRTAADPMAYPEQLTETGLQTWQVGKVHLCCNTSVLQRKNGDDQHRRDASQIGNIQFRTQTLAPRYGQTFGDMAQAAYPLLETEPEPPTAIVPFCTVFDVTAMQQNCNPVELNRGSLMNAISLPRGSEARRAMQGLSMVPHYEKLQQRAQHQNTARGIIIGLGRGSQLADGNRILSQAENLTQRLDRNATVQTLLEMGHRLHRTGEWDAAAEIYLRIMGTAPTHVSAKAAYAWLLQYMSSFDEGERDGKRDAATNHLEAKLDRSEIMQTMLESGTSHAFADDLGVRPAGASGNREIVHWGKGETKSYDQYEKSLMLADYVAKIAPDVLNDPKVRFCLAAAQIRNGEPRLAEGYYIKRSMAPNDDIWAVRAASELWAASGDIRGSLQGQNRSNRHLPTISCRLTAERPFLDGKLDDEIWSQCTPVAFSKPDETTGANSSSNAQIEPTASRSYRELTDTRSQAFGTEAMFLYDNEFLYVALKCRKSGGFAYRYRDFREIPRTHDPNLVREDRVELLLDRKRNYTTYDAFELDYRGWISESRWQDRNWNPRWFVARHEDETHWYVEAAIPLDQLTHEKPKPGALWGVALRRLVPGVGIEAWNAKNSFNTREGFGYLVFE